MKKIILIIAVCLLNLIVVAQKHDNTWVVGRSTKFGPIQGFGLSILDFSDLSKIKVPTKSNMDFDETLASISDKTGKLAFYTNGQLVENFEHDTLKNGVFFENQTYGWTIHQGAMILPYPQKDSLYMVLYQASGFLPGTNEYGIKKFYYATVDMSKNGGKGEVTEKSKSVFNFIPAYGKLNAVKHGNGVDWWILLLEYKTNRFYRYILSKDGLKYEGIQNIGEIDPEGVGCAVFSPDGTKYARYDDQGSFPLIQSINVYDFNRCNGLLSNNKNIKFDDKGGAGLAFSPNSRYLYAGLGDEIRQYDMQESSLKKGEVSISKRDNHISCLDVLEGFDNGQLAPNGKIYLSTDGCSKVLHVIHQPDLAGKACKIELHGVILPTSNALGVPNFPNFRLGKMLGCKTRIEDVEKQKIIEIFPNPVYNNLTVNVLENIFQNGELSLFDLQGKKINQFALNPKQENYNFDLSNQPNGIYLWQLLLDGKLRQQGKLVVMHEE
jgi:hypothetical protein